MFRFLMLALFVAMTSAFMAPVMPSKVKQSKITMGGGPGSGDPGDFEAPVVVVPTGSGGGGGKVIVINPGGGTPSTDAPHRVHFHPQARRWRIKKGHQHVALVEAGDGKYDVYLKPGRSFRDVKVQWQDRGGVWHDH